ncbi:FliA/WhiG family RNA polymerase sigma factor [Bacillus sp. ISL-47]|uniref:FliA/WhiG family RNA polymerase sigma factor n=1 Tax=Bacillus sp. ISL-47 TaxID=2819130 RepID=UPI001BE95909|nr:FliA/WhiG family RNA polymerase sigma factor [Bacillus sp. ISL-47]MBT2688582.1 FliA/WhiG family RNA polymerase sigma factor [Bacillus sp. ISL-47]MBT2708880.1 FliA/WhiG family RNA polymerase sigma factor [Pseudomonas sp. ISL-84]
MAELTIEENTYWAKWVDSRDAQAGNFLAKRYMPLVSYHVQRISVNLPKSVSRDDIRSLGMMGLYDALEKFDPKRDLKFDTYASFRIRGAILDGLRKEDWLPRSTREKAKKIEAAMENLEQRLMRNATVGEIADEVQMGEEEVYTVMNEHFYANVLSIDEQPGDSDDKEGGSFAIKDDKAVIPEEKVLKNEILEEMAERILQLNEKEQLVISLFYKEELTLTEIGEVMGLSTSRISQIHSKAIFKLRQSLGKVL